MRLSANHPALTEKRTIHTKRVFSVDAYRNKILKPINTNSKIGKGSNVIIKGKWKGFPLFGLTLEERKTCPPCIHEDDCYGNNTPFAHRFQPGKDLELRIAQEIDDLAKRYPRGFAVRLHILGDFYSLRYVALWFTLIKKYPNLHVYGYTAHDPNSDMGSAIRLVGSYDINRWWIRHSVSRYSGYDMVATKEYTKGDIICPEQTGKSESCLTCGLCWSIEKPVHFITHKREKKNA